MFIAISTMCYFVLLNSTGVLITMAFNINRSHNNHSIKNSTLR
ncbi:hypothetical protein BTN50_1654 (plasmid) [Candidatus Enterovibrio altilux]|uniref:Uncharacterized protein n=1 Tax=Candidatus Enterovibrio altilux TaxID=1927128 RepID=A0A291BAQ9_9GAMM|nr:hypothetical protein BTN50_1654 [Candidatus Enterovibrio luxaltus]